jgi:hypothetical protein
MASRTPLGSPLFFGLILIFVLAYCAMLWRVWHEDATDRKAIRLALIFAVLFRLPLALAPVGADSDMVRYLWDGRVQQRGYNPYAVVPSDPAMAATHTSESERMPSRRAGTPSPPRSSFRLVVGIHDSTLAEAALVFCDMLTIVVLSRWLIAIGCSEWLTLAYAWNPFMMESSLPTHRWLGALWPPQLHRLTRPDGSRDDRLCWPSRRNSCRSSSPALRRSNPRQGRGHRRGTLALLTSVLRAAAPGRTPELPTARWARFPASSPTPSTPVFLGLRR